MVQLCEAQPDLNGNPFLRVLELYLETKREQKRLGVEGGIAAQKINFIDFKI